MSTATVLHVTGQPLAQEFDDLFREHSAMVYRTAFSVTGCAEDAEDVLQTLFLWLLRRGIPTGLKENPKAYLYRAAVNLSLNAVKTRRRQILTGDPARFETAIEPHASSAAEEAQDRLVQAIAQLGRRSVEMLILRYEHNYSDAEIGKLLGTSRGVIAVTLHRARARLKKLLRGDTP